MKKNTLLSLLVMISACSFAPSQNKTPPTPSWITESNKLATEYALSDSERYPEDASSIGFAQYDVMALQLEDDMETQDRAHLYKWKERLEKELNQDHKSTDYITDIKVLLKNINTAILNIPIEDKYPSGMICPISRAVFSNLRELINDQSPPARKKAAAERFNKYVRGHGRFKPYAEACRSRLEYLEKKYGKSKIIRPLKQDIEQYLKESPQYMEGIKKLLQESTATGWEADLEEFTKHIQENDSYILKRILPHARTTYKIPRELYIANIHSRGIETTPEELIKVARADFEKGLIKYRSLAKEVAKKFKLKKSDPISVLKYLKKDQVSLPKDAEKLYADANLFLTQVLIEHDLVTIPKAPLKIRLAGEVESKAAPFPHLNAPPLIGNTGQRPEFVVPTAAEGKLPFDDFSYRASALIITAHEGRPGHDLQFSTMQDQGVSLIRARFAFNNVNVEGWGLYAEEIVFPYVPVEAQFAGMQTRLLRIARMFLDPEVSLGKIGRAGVISTLTSKVGVSPVLADLEFKRYSYDDPGQAPSYYFGLKRMLEIKASLASQLGPKFTEKCFNDAVLSLGLLPLDLIGQKLKATMNCTGKTP